MTNVGKLTQLKSLRLESTGITDAGLSDLKGLTGLQTLDVSQSRVG